MADENRPTPAEDPTFETDTVAANRAVENGQGLGAREIAALHLLHERHRGLRPLRIDRLGFCMRRHEAARHEQHRGNQPLSGTWYHSRHTSSFRTLSNHPHATTVGQALLAMTGTTQQIAWIETRPMYGHTT